MQDVGTYYDAARVMLCFQGLHRLQIFDITGHKIADTDAKGNYIYVVTPANKVERRDVRLGAMIGNLQTILEGVKPGEIVIVDGTHKAAPGAQVNPVRAK